VKRELSEEKFKIQNSLHDEGGHACNSSQGGRGHTLYLQRSLIISPSPQTQCGGNPHTPHTCNNRTSYCCCLTIIQTRLWGERERTARGRLALPVFLLYTMVVVFVNTEAPLQECAITNAQQGQEDLCEESIRKELRETPLHLRSIMYMRV
jgi:hypothetical protein